MKLARVFCFLVLFGASAVAAYAQTPVDPKVVFHTPDPPCSGCIDLEYTGPSLTPTETAAFFFGVPFPGELPIPPEYSCEADGSGGGGPISCLIVKTTDGLDFLGVFLFVPGLTMDETFSLAATGGSLDLTLPPNSGLVCVTASQCSPDGVIALTSTPEPGTALLFMTGLIGVVGFVRKRFGAGFLT